jgi:hypothetical protein
MKQANWDLGCLKMIVIIAILSIPAWLTHIIYCIKTEEWFFLIAGAIAAPIAIIHGWMIWFGFG